MSDKNTDQNQSNSDWSKREIGALWKRVGSNQKYLTGKVKVDGSEKSIVVFVNKHKTKDNHPDFRVYLSRDNPNAVGTTESAGSTSKSEAQEDLL